MTTQRTASRLFAGLLVMLLALSPSLPGAFAAELPDFPTLIKQNGMAVVNIRIERDGMEKTSLRMPHPPGNGQLPELFEHFFNRIPQTPSPRRDPVSAIGSGFIISPDGYIVTNAHVIDAASGVIVTLPDRRELKARIVGADQRSDIALLKIDAEGLPVVKLGDSDTLQVGQWVFAIGAPFGFDHTATQGIVSALSRSLPDGTYVPFIQTDVAVNPGNSGGPLFDLDGNVVGVNSQIYSRTGGYMGLSFAIPVNIVKNITGQLKSQGYVSRGWLGVSIQDMNQNLARSFKLDTPQGALVADVEADSPAGKAGFRTGDIIIAFEQTRIDNAADLPPLVGAAKIGDTITIKVLRKGKEKHLGVKIMELADNSREPQEVATGKTGSLGIMISRLPEERGKTLGLNGKGVLIHKVAPHSPAGRAGLQEGDILVSFNSTEVSDPEALKAAVKASPTGEPLAVLVIRNEQTRFLTVTRQESVS